MLKSFPFNKLPTGEAALNNLYGSYKSSSIKRGVEFFLEKEEFKEIISKNCYYCGEVPKNVLKIPRLNGSLVYNGIDRVNNKLGYIKGNIIPCCKVCNYAKHTKTQEEFLGWIIKLCNYQSQKLNEK